MPPPAVTPLQLRRRAVPADRYAALPAHLDPVLRRVYAARGVDPAAVEPALGALHPVGSLGGVAEAAALLAAARREQAGIVIVGDFDADGATATALGVTVLRAMGFTRVSYLVPNRFELGYGLSPAIVDLAARLQPRILVTVDNGISSIEGVARAQALGIDVVIADHHLPGPVLPAARVIIDPNLPGETFPSKALCGVGVAFYLLAALARELDRQGLAPYEASRRAVLDGLDLVALGTVADLVPLDHNNRVLVAEGLRRIRAGRCRPGLRALFAVAGRDPAMARSADLGYALAPRLNAAGRLTDMALGIDCLLATDAGTARELAARLDQLNSERQELQARMQAQAEQHWLDQAESLAGSHEPALCLYDPQWHEGIVGLVASRLRERTGRPVVAFAPAGEAGWLKGSARSIDGVHIRDTLANIAARGTVPGLGFGGHAMAAGLRLPAAALDVFRVAFVAELSGAVGAGDGEPVLWTDGPLDAGELGLDLAEVLHLAGPWGQGCPEPLFDNEFEVVEQRVLREAHLRLGLRHVDGGAPLEAIAFRETRRLPARVRLAYRFGVNDFGGRRRPQLVVEHIQYD